jgi:hypothetical protein
MNDMMHENEGWEMVDADASVYQYCSFLGEFFYMSTTPIGYIFERDRYEWCSLYLSYRQSLPPLASYNS